MERGPGPLLVKLLTHNDAEARLAKCRVALGTNDFPELEKSLEVLMGVEEVAADHESHDIARDVLKELNLMHASHQVTGPWGVDHTIHVGISISRMEGILHDLAHSLMRTKIERLSRSWGTLGTKAIEQVHDIIRDLLSREQDPWNSDLDYKLWCDTRTSGREYSWLHSRMKSARHKVAPILYRQRWRDEIEPKKPFPFMKLPRELRGLVYGFLLPGKQKHAIAIHTIIGTAELTQEHTALPAPPTVLRAGAMWDSGHEHFWSLSSTCWTIRDEAAEYFYTQPVHEITLADSDVYWLGRKDLPELVKSQIFMDKFCMIRSIRLTIYTSTNVEAMKISSELLQIIVGWMQRMKELRSLDVVYLPYPVDPMPTAPAYILLSDFERYLVAPLSALHGIEKVNFMLDRGPLLKDSPVSRNIIYGGLNRVPICWRKQSRTTDQEPRFSMPHLWYLAGPKVDERWEEITTTIISKMQASRLDASEASDSAVEDMDVD